MAKGDQMMWGASFLGTGGPPPAPEKHTPKPKCRCGWFTEREHDGVMYCFGCFERVSGKAWDAP